MFGRHIAGGADGKTGLCERGRALFALAEDARHAKIEDLEGAAVADAFEQDEIFGFEIAVDDAVSVSDIQGTEKLFKDLKQDVAWGDAKALDVPLEGFSFEPFHDEEGAKSGEVTEVDDLYDIFVSERGEEARFALEALDHEGISCEVRVEDLDGEGIAKLDVMGEINGAKAAAADLFA